jgi:hypothetical protein
VGTTRTWTTSRASTTVWTDPRSSRTRSAVATATATLPDPRFTTYGVYIETVLKNPYIFHEPTPKQAKFLMRPHREALFGGAAGGGKSDDLLMAALQYIHEPGYAAIIFRKSYRDLAQPGAIMDRIKSWHSTWTRELGIEAN